MIKPYDVSIEVAYPAGEGGEPDAREYLISKGYPDHTINYSGSRKEPTGVTKGSREDENAPEELDIYVFSPFEI